MVTGQVKAIKHLKIECLLFLCWGETSQSKVSAEGIYTVRFGTQFWPFCAQ